MAKPSSDATVQLTNDGRVELVSDAGEVRSLHGFYYPWRIDVTVDLEGPSMCRQEFADECDVNKIMQRAERDGVAWPPPLPQMEPNYVDFLGVPDNLQDALNTVMDAEAAFMRLSANVRREFDNDPLQFVAFASDEANLDQMRKWGLAKPLETPPPAVRVEVVPGAAPAPSGAGAAPGASAAAPAAGGPPVGGSGGTQ